MFTYVISHGRYSDYAIHSVVQHESEQDIQALYNAFQTVTEKEYHPWEHAADFTEWLVNEKGFIELSYQEKNVDR